MIGWPKKGPFAMLSRPSDNLLPNTYEFETEAAEGYARGG